VPRVAGLLFLFVWFCKSVESGGLVHILLDRYGIWKVPEIIYCPEITDQESERSFEIVREHGGFIVPDLISNQLEPVIFLLLLADLNTQCNRMCVSASNVTYFGISLKS
jgi:hypothetical protein